MAGGGAAPRACTPRAATWEARPQPCRLARVLVRVARPASAPRTRDAAEDCPGSSQTVLEHVVRQSGEAALNAACNRDGWVRKSGTASPLTYFPCSCQRVVRCVTVCACFTYLLPLIGCLTPIVGYKASRKKAIAQSLHIPHSLITVCLLTQHHSPPPGPYSQTASRLLVQYEHPSVNPPVAHCILRFPTPAPHTKRTSYTAVQQPAVRVGVGVVVASSPLGRTASHAVPCGQCLGLILLVCVA